MKGEKYQENLAYQEKYSIILNLMAAQRLRNVQRGFGDQLLDALERNAVLFLSRDSSCSTVRGRLYPVFHYMLQMFSLVKVVQPFLPQSHAVVFHADLVLSS